MKKLLLLLCTLLAGASGAWADVYKATLGSKVTDLGTLSPAKYYVLKNVGTSKYNYYDSVNSRLDAMTGLGYSCVLVLDYDSSAGTVTIKQVQTGTYYQGLTSGSRPSLGDTSVDYTITTAYSEGIFFLSNNSLKLNTNNTNKVPQGADSSWEGDFSRWEIYEVTVSSALESNKLYTLSFVSGDGTNTWYLSSSTTTVNAPSTDSALASTFVAYEYTNSSGESRWIFVNNSDGYYLAYRAATATFNISKPINEFKVGELTPAFGNVTNNDCRGCYYMTADNRSTSSTAAGCYILKESTSAWDNSDAPFYNGTFTSALTFTEVDEDVSNVATLAIAKFNALYEVKDYLTYASNISALFASPSSIEANINAATTATAAATVASNFMKSPEGKKFYAESSYSASHFLNVESSLVSATSSNLTAAAVMEATYAGNGKYYLKGVLNNKYIGTPAIPPTTAASTEDAATFYIGNYANTTDNCVYFSISKNGDSAEEAIHYSSSTNPTNYTCAWGYDGAASQWNITYISDSDYELLAAATEYEITYTLTDMNGKEYEGSYTSTLGTKPTLTGCYNYTLSNETWDFTNHTYSANITFPFNVSSNDVTNWVYIYNNNSDYKWHVGSAEATKAIVKKDDVPTYSKHTNYEWAIYPSISETGAVTFTIKNNCTGKFITSTSTSKSHSGAVTLTSTGTSLTYILDGDYPRWCLPTTENNDGTTKLELSFNSSTNTEEQELGTWSAHNLTASWAIAATDFATLYSNLNAACTAFEPYRAYIGSGLGQYSGDTSSNMVTIYDGIIRGADPTAAEMQTWTTALENPATKLTLNLPATGGFYKIKGHATSKYAKAGTITASNVNAGNDPTSYIPNSTGTETNGSDIWYYDSDNHLINYYNGLGTVATRAFAALSKTKETTTFAESTCTAGGAQKIGVYEIKSNYTGSKLWYSNTNNVDRNGNNNNVNCEWDVEEVTSLPVTVSSAHWASLYAPVALTVPEGVTAYWGEDNDDRVTLNAIEAGSVIPAETGVVVYAEEAGTYSFAITTGGSIDGENALAGTVATITRTQTESKYDSYILSGGSNGVGFYRDGASTLQGFKSYLPAGESGGSVKTFSFDTETGLEAIGNGQRTMNNGSIYSLSGQKVNGKLPKGLYIVGGKKMLVK